MVLTLSTILMSRKIINFTTAYAVRYYFKCRALGRSFFMRSVYWRFVLDH